MAIIDDHQAVTEMLCQVVAGMAGCQVVGCATDARSAVELCRREKPDLVLLDLVIPPTSGFVILEEARKVCRNMRALIFSAELRAAEIQRALSSGASALVGKMAPLHELREAIEAVRAGRVFLSRSASEEIREFIYQRGGELGEAEPLTHREATVLRAIAEGYRSKEIATHLGLSVHTVVNHRTRLVKKTGLRGVAQLSRYAAQIGLVGGSIKLATPPDPPGGLTPPGRPERPLL